MTMNPQEGAGPQKSTGEALEESRSVFNPTDLAAMTQSKRLSAGMTVRDFFAQLGVDVDGPVGQLIEMSKQQMENADPRAKMQKLAQSRPANPGAMPGPPTGGGGAPPQAPQAPGGLGDLMR